MNGERCACAAIDAGRVGFCRDHGRALIPGKCDAQSAQLIEALAADAGIDVKRPCGSFACGGADAAFRVHWPAQPINLCAPCTRRAITIAGAIGIRLEADPLPRRGRPS